MNNYIRLIKYVKPHSGVLILASVCMLLNSVFDGVSIGIVIPIVDKVLSGKDIIISQNAPLFVQGFINKINSIPLWRLLNLIMLVFICAFMLKAIFMFLQSYLMNDVSHKVVRDIRDQLYQKLLRLPMSFYSKSKTGALVSRITYDTTVVRDSISEGLTDLIFQTFQVIIYISAIVIVASMFSIHWGLILGTVVFIPIVVFPVVKIGQKLRKISKSSQERMADLNSTLYETISGSGIVKAFGMEDYEMQKFQRQNQGYYKIIMKSVKRIIGISPFTEFIGVTCAVVVLWFGGRQVISGALSAGAFIAFLAALLSMIKPFKRLSRVHSINQGALAAASRIFEILDEEETIKDAAGAVTLNQLEDGVKFEKVFFGYDSKQILEDINVDVKKGQILAIVGASGVGKTSLVNLVPRFYDPTGGKVTIDGKDIKECTVDSLRDKIGLVTQDTFLFNDTVKANISYGHLQAGMDKIAEAAKAANAHDFINKMPKGYDTVIGERGFKLSGGERQRLALARALLKDPPILILDEATSQLDTESERLVQEAIDRLMANRTVLVIAHRLSTVRHADKIIALDKGRIAESGSHEELMAKNGLYRKLYDLQFRSELLKDSV